MGTYQHGPTQHVVSLDADGQLTLSPTGQPTYRLAPYQAGTFAIDTLPGFRLEFRLEPSGVVETIVFTSRMGRSWRGGWPSLLEGYGRAIHF